MRFLDNVLQHFIDNAPSQLEKAKYSAYRERSIGLGAMGFHAYLQKNNIPFEGPVAASANHMIFKHIKNDAMQETLQLAVERGACPDDDSCRVRNAHLLAIAPNASSSIICGGTSPSIEPYRANVYTHKTLSGSYQVKNKYLEKLFKSKGIKGKKLTELWKDIAGQDGSVQHLKVLTDEEKEIFKTANEINQIWVVEHAHQRQDFICQSQSVNLFFVLPKATEPQAVHDEYMQYVNDVHWYGANKLKSLYYFRSNAARNAENVNVKIPRIKLDEGCIACEG